MFPKRCQAHLFGVCFYTLTKRIYLPYVRLLLRLWLRLVEIVERLYWNLANKSQ
jgi:hypothetical protein